MDFYDKSGKPVAYMDDSGHIYLYSGKPVGYVANDSVYAFSGKHLGWFEDGWIRDHKGACAMFTDDASGGPMQPMKQMKPMKGMRQMLPMPGMRNMAPMRSMDSLGWSQTTGVAFFA